jgi:hypothetical protein
MKNYGRLTSWLIAGWFIFALGASALNAFRNGPERLGIAVAMAAGAPIPVFVAWFAASKEFREYTWSLNPKVLTSLQVWRIVGFVFLWLEARRELPAVFAIPAGYGDIFIGITAAFVAWHLAQPQHRNSFITWQLLGITDLVVAVSTGTTARLIDPHGTSMLSMTVLPLSLVPTFLVPLFMIFHVICIAQARNWRSGSLPTRQTARAEQQPAA